MIKDINGGGHRVILLVRGPAKKLIFLQGSLATVLLHFRGHSYILDGSKNLLALGKCLQASPVDIRL